MIKCPKCGTQNEDDANFCEECALRLSLAEKDSGDEGGGCPDCGGRVEERPGGEGVCTECGAKLLLQDDSGGVGSAEPAPPVPAPEGDLVTVYTTASGLAAFTEGALVRSQLEAAGFAAEMLNTQHTSMVFGGGVAIGIRIVVPQSQADAARRFLRDSGHTRVLGPLG